MKNGKIIKSMLKIGMALAVVFSFSKLEKIGTTDSLLYDRAKSEDNSFVAGTWGEEKPLSKGLKIKDDEPEAPVAGAGALTGEIIENPDPEAGTGALEEEIGVPAEEVLADEEMAGDEGGIAPEEKPESLPEDATEVLKEKAPIAEDPPVDIPVSKDAEI